MSRFARARSAAWLPQQHITDELSNPSLCRYKQQIQLTLLVDTIEDSSAAESGQLYAAGYEVKLDLNWF
eukprot:6175017-Pleurochrysis_carterae.AAC.2